MAQGDTLAKGSASPDDVRALQTSLRALGYHREGVTGVWGSGTDAAVAALRYDLLNNNGPGPGADAQPLVTIASFNSQGLVVAAPDSGPTSVEPALNDCITALMADDRVGKVPQAPDAVAGNAHVMAVVTAMNTPVAPTPFMLAIFRQESGGAHYHVPQGGDQDGFVIVGLDHNDAANPEAVTSRGYGIGQYTFFHHPLSPAEIATLVQDPVQNALAAFQELRGKFNTAVVAKTPGAGADDRAAEHPLTPLRECKYSVGDARRFTDCANCTANTRKLEIAAGDPVYAGSKDVWQPTHYYPSATYHAVPDRADFPCDWPYAVRRYNGAGPNSYHYQARVLTYLAQQPHPAGG